MRIASQEGLLNHFPYFAEESSTTYKLKHQELSPKDKGLWLLHGHVHEKWKVKGRMINVGVDAWDFYPIPISTIESIISDHGIQPVDSKKFLEKAEEALKTHQHAMDKLK